MKKSYFDDNQHGHQRDVKMHV